METNPLREKMLPDEYFVWEGKPDKLTFILKSALNPLLPFALIWICFDGFALHSILSDRESVGSFIWFIIPFFAVHLAPVWIYLYQVISSFFSYKNTYYLLTDRTVYVSSGVRSVSVHSKPIAWIGGAETGQGFIEKKFGLGSVYTDTVGGGRDSMISIKYVPDYERVAGLILRQIAIYDTAADIPRRAGY